MVYPVRGILQVARSFAEHQQRRTVLYVAALVTAALATAGALVQTGYGLQAPWTVLALATAAALAERASVRVTKTWEYSISLLPTLFAAVLFGPFEAAIVGAASMLGDPELISRRNPDRAPRLKWATYTCTRFIGGVAMGIAAQSTLALVGSGFEGLIAASLVGAVVGETLDVLFAAVTSRVRGRPMRDAFQTVTPIVLLSAPAYAPVIAVLALAYIEVSAWTLALFLVPSLAAQRVYGLYQEQRRLADDLSVANETLERANLQFAGALIATLDARDRYTAGHSAAVAIYSRDIARRMGLPEETRELAYLCGLVHDIGKIGLPPGLLEKPGALTLEERRQMQEHSAIGERILAHVAQYSEIATIVRHHHERIDGQGYPDGVADDDIPLVSRIIAVADAYNAMTSDRPYRDAMPSRVARLRLAQAVDSQFDTAAVAAFEAILAGADEEYRVATRADFRAFAQSTYETPSASDSSVAEVA
jgi:putative nucleotidyltransferase with HDIG domain